MPNNYLAYTATVILQTLANGCRYGFDLMDITGLPSGTVYPALRRLEEMGLVESKWEKHDIAQKELRPPRKYYEVTKDGEEKLVESVKRYKLLEQQQLAKQPRRPIKERG
jgi:PadR family transcriptional regulator PadR